MMRFLNYLGFAVLLSLSSSSWAALISYDFSSAGDELLTRDTGTSLEWLDLTVTTSLSYNDIVGGYGDYLTTHGFRYATALEVNQLITNAGGDNPAGIQTLLDMLGCTINCASANPGARGIIPQTGGLVEYTWYLNDGAESDPFILGDDGAELTTGHFLVRDFQPVSEPVAGMFMIFGLAGLLVSRRQRTKS